MTGKDAAARLQVERKFLMNILKDFKPEHEGFRPTPEMMSVAQQINHIAHTIDWFREGGFGAGWDMDFAKFAAENARPVTLAQAMARLEKAYSDWGVVLESTSEASLGEPMPPNDILGPQPRVACLDANADHTAHHRGALTVYQRLLGIAPTMVYM